MTVSTTTNKISYTASGSQDTFAYNFKIFNESDLEVYVRESNTDVLKTNYTVTGVGNNDGGNIVFVSPYKPSSGQVVTIWRVLDIIQDTDYVANDPFPAEAHEDALDYRCMVEQQINEKIARNITVPITDQATDLELPNESVRADRYFIFDSDGNVSVSLTTISGGTASHDNLSGLLDDDHLQYLLASQATDRATFTAGWADLTDGGNTTLHIHDSRYYTESEVDAVETSLDNKISTTSGTLQLQITANADALAALDTTYATDAELTAVSGSLYAGYVAADTTLSGLLYSGYVAADAVVDAKIDTTSGTLQSQIDGLTVDHGALTGLGDDDHTQYLLRTDFTTYSGAIVAGYTAADAVLDSKIDTTSGTLQANIDAVNTTITGSYVPTTLTTDTIINVDGNTLYIMNGANEIATFYSLAGGVFTADHHGIAAFETTAGGIITLFGSNSTYYKGTGIYKTVGGTNHLGINAEAHAIFMTSASGVSVHHGEILSVDRLAAGDAIYATVDDASATYGDVLYQAADFHYERANASSSTTAPAVAIMLDDGAGSSKSILLKGEYCHTDWNWSAGKLYLDTSAGQMTQTVVSGSGQQLQVLGWALSADTIWFDPDRTVVEVA